MHMVNFIQELDTGCFDSSFTAQEEHLILCGHFHTASLSLIEKPGSTTLRLICHHSKEDVFGQSMNSWLDSSMDATIFYMVADAADLMSFTF